MNTPEAGGLKLLEPIRSPHLVGLVAILYNNCLNLRVLKGVLISLLFLLPKNLLP
jgi:hypothetical protein